MILEDENENFDDDQLISDDSLLQSYSHDIPKHHKWVQKVHQAPVGPPQGLNELTKTVGKRKRFSSKDFRESQLQENRPQRRVITISN